jgi:hypothetical protein
VPCNPWVRALSERRPPTRPGGKPRLPAFERVDRGVARPPKGRWRQVTVRDGEKGPLAVQVLLARVPTKDEDGGGGAWERRAVLRRCAAQPPTWSSLSNDHDARRGEVARVPGARPRSAELLAQGNGEVGRDP